MAMAQKGKVESGKMASASRNFACINFHSRRREEAAGALQKATKQTAAKGNADGRPEE